MGEARKRVQAAINLHRDEWQKITPVLEKNIAKLEKELGLMTGDEPYYSDVDEKVERLKKVLSRVIRLSALPDQELRRRYKEKGYIG